jgi:hypothetical protein
MVLSYNPITSNSIRPPYCRCGNRHFHIHSYYWRIIAKVLIQRFICLACKHTVSMIPNNCVPYKHYPVSIINPVIDGMMLHGKSGYYYELKTQLGIHRSTACRWYNEFCQYSGILATEGMRRLRLQPLPGKAKAIYQSLKSHFVEFGNEFFSAFQVLLCNKPPPIGIFRSFSF